MGRFEYKHNAGARKRRRTRTGRAFGASMGTFLAKQAIKKVAGMFGKSTNQDNAQGAITQQNDSKNLYKRRRAPRRVRAKAKRRAGSFLKKQLMVLNQKSNLYTATQATSNTINSQAVQTIVSGAFSGDIAATGDQVGNLVSLIQNERSNVNVNHIAIKAYLISMSIDYTFVNSSNFIMELDVYTWVARRDFNLHSGVARTLGEYFDFTLASQTIIGTAGTALLSTTVGVTPYDNSMFCRNIIIMSKQRYYISAGQAISYVVNKKWFKPKRIPMWLSGGIASTATEDTNSIYAAGITRGVFCVHRGVPSATNNCGDITTLLSCAQVNYKFKVMNDEVPQAELGSNV